MRILAIDDDPLALDYLEQVFNAEHSVCRAAGGGSGIATLQQQPFDLVLLDLRMPQVDGFMVLQHLQNLPAAPPVIVLTGVDTASAAVRALELGASDYIVKPADPATVRAAITRLGAKGASAAPSTDYGFLGVSPPIRRLHRLIPLLASTTETLLIQGPTGTGKDLLARIVHGQGPRYSGPFVAHNMAATPGELAESVFFGHVRGAFSGAIADHVGVFEQAHGGTLFLDEVDSFPLSLQAKLLRVLESGCVQRVGCASERPFDVRVIAASTVDLGGLVEKGVFRSDLYYRLRQIEVFLPPLCERREDIPVLVEHFLALARRDMEWSARVTPAASEALLAYHWPGNVRELRNAVRAAVLLAVGGPIQPGHLPRALRLTAGAPGGAPGSTGGTLVAVERDHIQRVLEATHGNRSLAARILGIDRGTLARKLREFALRAPKLNG